MSVPPTPTCGSGEWRGAADLLGLPVYLLTEVTLGTCRIVPVDQFVTVRLHCARLLQRLPASTGTFVPTTSLLLGVLDHREVGIKPLRGGGGDGGGKRRAGKKNKSAEGATVRGLRLPLILKFPKESTLRTLEQLDKVLKETFVLLKREVDLYSGVLFFNLAAIKEGEGVCRCCGGAFLCIDPV